MTGNVYMNESLDVLISNINIIMVPVHRFYVIVMFIVKETPDLHRLKEDRLGRERREYVCFFKMYLQRYVVSAFVSSTLSVRCEEESRLIQILIQQCLKVSSEMFGHLAASGQAGRCHSAAFSHGCCYQLPPLVSVFYAVIQRCSSSSRC